MSVLSPCVNICRMDAASSEGAICVGCFRTLDEIAQWSRADDSRKRAILTAVEKRRAEQDRNGRDFPGDGDR